MNHHPTLPGMEHEVRKLELSQWYTPPWLAERVWLWYSDYAAPTSVFGQEAIFHVLEPSAGDGALLKPALASGRVEHALAIDIDERNIAKIAARFPSTPALRVMCADFRTLAPIRAPFHVALMNPPYENDQDTFFILHAFNWAPDVVGIFRSAILHGSTRFERLWRWTDLVRGTWLANRPEFGAPEPGKKDKSNGAESDYVVLHLRRRELPRARGEAIRFWLEWW